MAALAADGINMTTPAQKIAPHLDRRKLNKDCRILLFDLSVGGHHPAYIQHLIRYWGEQDIPGRLDILVVPKFVQKNLDVMEMASTYGRDRVNFVAITDAEEAKLGPWTNLIRRRWRIQNEWSLLKHYITVLGSTECLLMYFDSYQLPIFIKRRLPCPFSGIYFRTRFHYGDFPECVLSWKDHLRHWQERVYISHVLRHPQLKKLFCLDQFAVKYLNQPGKQSKAIYLPDPVQTYGYNQSQVEELRTSLGIEQGRRVFLLFGVLDSRKGIYQLLEAILLLPPALCQNLCLLLVGPLNSQDKELVQKQISKIANLLPAQIVLYDKFVIERENQPFFHLSDIVLAPYQRHAGTSSILIRAAAAQKPVLSTNYGLMGEWTRYYQLGITIDSTAPSEIAKGLTQFLIEKPTKFFNHDKARDFAEQNSAEKYADTIFTYLLESHLTTS